jgi:hypothetical protein
VFQGRTFIVPETRPQRSRDAGRTDRGNDKATGPTPWTSSVSIDTVSAEHSSPPIDCTIRA